MSASSGPWWRLGASGSSSGAAAAAAAAPEARALPPGLLPLLLAAPSDSCVARHTASCGAKRLLGTAASFCAASDSSHATTCAKLRV
jgi:hypothetical protein